MTTTMTLARLRDLRLMLMIAHMEPFHDRHKGATPRSA